MSTELVSSSDQPKPQQQPLLPMQESPSPDLMSGPLAFWCSWDTATQEGKGLVVKCMGNSDLKGSDAINLVFPTANVLAHAVEIIDQGTGMVQQMLRCVLVGKDGRTLAFVSAGITQSLRVILGLYGKGPWEPELLLRVKQVPTRRGFKTFVLTVEQPDPPANGDRKTRR